jgi:ElaB/YqjD/DUF883 family membrane-anchored ribosome-binding protein
MIKLDPNKPETTYAADQQIFPIRPDRIVFAAVLAAAFVIVPLAGNDYCLRTLRPPFNLDWRTPMTARFERSRDSLVKDFTEVLTEADALLKQATKETGERAIDLRAQDETKLRAAKAKLQDVQGEAMDRAKVAARATDEYVRDNPWQALGVAAAVGVLIGLLMSRRQAGVAAGNRRADAGPARPA